MTTTTETTTLLTATPTSPDLVPVDTWGPLREKAPTLPNARHVALSILLGVALFPLIPVFGFIAATGDATGAAPWMSGSGAGMMAGLVSLWAGLLTGVAVAARRYPGGIKALIDWRFSRRDPLIAVAFVAVALGFNFAVSWLLGVLGIPAVGNTSAFTAVTGPWQIAVMASVMVFGPMVEEVFFRGLVLHVALRRFSKWGALAVTSLMFGLMHAQPTLAGSLFTISMTGLVGLGLGWIRLRTGRLGTSMCAHIGFNSAGIILAMLGV